MWRVPVELAAVESIGRELEDDLTGAAAEARLVHDLAVGSDALGGVDRLGAGVAFFGARRLLFELDRSGADLIDSTTAE